MKRNAGVDCTDMEGMKNARITWRKSIKERKDPDARTACRRAQKEL
jgi:hypothetical protein